MVIRYRIAFILFFLTSSSILFAGVDELKAKIEELKTRLNQTPTDIRVRVDRNGEMIRELRQIMDDRISENLLEDESLGIAIVELLEALEREMQIATQLRDIYRQQMEPIIERLEEIRRDTSLLTFGNLRRLERGIAYARVIPIIRTILHEGEGELINPLLIQGIQEFVHPEGSDAIRIVEAYIQYFREDSERMGIAFPELPELQEGTDEEIRRYGEALINHFRVIRQRMRLIGEHAQELGGLVRNNTQSIILGRVRPESSPEVLTGFPRTVQNLVFLVQNWGESQAREPFIPIQRRPEQGLLDYLTEQLEALLVYVRSLGAPPSGAALLGGHTS